MKSFLPEIVCLLLIGLLSGNCGFEPSASTQQKATVEAEMADLTTIEARAEFLNTIYESDQRARNEHSAATQQFGYQSPQDLEAVAVLQETDRINRERIRAYLKQFPYPDLQQMGDAAAAAPWLVIHHSPSVEFRRTYLDTLYRAYQNGNIQQNGWTLFLKRLDEMVNGEMLIMEGRYKPEDELTELYRRLRMEGYDL